MCLVTEEEQFLCWTNNPLEQVGADWQCNGIFYVEAEISVANLELVFKCVLSNFANNSSSNHDKNSTLAQCFLYKQL